MSFVIRAIDDVHISYIGVASQWGFSSLVDRPQAAIFQTADEAQKAIENLPDGFRVAGLRFSIETVEADQAPNLDD